MAQRAKCAKKIPMIELIWQFVQDKEELAKRSGRFALRVATGVSWKRGWWSYRVARGSSASESLGRSR